MSFGELPRNFSVPPTSGEANTDKVPILRERRKQAPPSSPPPSRCQTMSAPGALPQFKFEVAPVLSKKPSPCVFTSDTSCGAALKRLDRQRRGDDVTTKVTSHRDRPSARRNATPRNSLFPPSFHAELDSRAREVTRTAKPPADAQVAPGSSDPPAARRLTRLTQTRVSKKG